MPSSLERSLSRALVYSTHPPVSVCGTGDRGKGLETFLGMTAGDSLRPKPRLSIRLVYHLTSCKFPALTPAGAGIFNLLCIDYALRPHLSSRLTLGGRTWPRKPWVYGDQDSSPGLSLLVSAFSLASAPPSVSVRLLGAGYALLPPGPDESGPDP